MAKIHDMEVDDYFANCVSVVPEALQEEFCRVAADLAYWGERYADALRAYEMAKLHRKKIEAQSYILHRETLEDKHGKKPTVADIEAAMRLDPVCEKVAIAEVEAEVAFTAIKNRFWAVSAKKDLLQSLGAQVRAEMQNTDPSVRKPRYDGDF